VKKLIGDILPWFDSKYFHIGGDESFDVGRGASKAAVNLNGLATVQANYYRKIYDFVHSHGKKVIMYGDMVLRHPATLAQLPDSLIIMDWHYGATDKFPSVKVFARAGQPFIVSPGVSSWYRLYPNQSAAWVNTYNLTLEGYNHGALGSVTSTWGDYGGPNFRELNYRGYAYAAECAWNPNEADEQTIDRRFDALFFATKNPQLAGIQNLLNQMSDKISFPEIWKHPFDRLHDFKQSHKYTYLNETANIRRMSDAVIRMDSTLKPNLKRNRQQLDYFTYAANLAHWTANSIEYARWMQRIKKNHIRPDSLKPFRQKAIQRGKHLEGRIETLKSRFDKLWLRTNRKANLNLLDTLFRYQKIYLDNIVQSLKKNKWDTSYKISSKFISAHRASDSHAVSKVYLRKTFHPTNKKIKHAYLQIVGDVTTVYLNGHQLGKSIAQREGSLGIDLKRAKYWKVGGTLHTNAKNVIAARVKSYYHHIPSGSVLRPHPAAVNVYLKIIYADGSAQTIQSDPYWKTQTSEQHNWTKVNYDDNDWLPAAVVKHSATVYKPQFDRDLPSFVAF
jgi:hypothetical protein